MCFGNVYCFIVGFVVLILLTLFIGYFSLELVAHFTLPMFMVWKRETNTQSIIVIKVHLFAIFYPIVMNSLLWKVARQRPFHLSDVRTLCECYLFAFFFLFVFSFSSSHMFAYAFHAAIERHFKWMTLLLNGKLENRFSGGYKEFIEMPVFLFLFLFLHSKSGNINCI